MARTSQHSSEEVDLLIYLPAGLLPTTRTQEMGCEAKGQVRDMVRAQYYRKLSKNPQRLDQLGENLENLPAIVLRLGYPPECFSPSLHDVYKTARGTWGKMQGFVSALPRPAKRALELGDAAEEGDVGAKRLQVSGAPAESTVDEDESEDLEEVHPDHEPAVVKETLAAQTPSPAQAVFLSLPQLVVPPLPGRSGLAVGPATSD